MARLYSLFLAIYFLWMAFNHFAIVPITIPAWHLFAFDLQESTHLKVCMDSECQKPLFDSAKGSSRDYRMVENMMLSAGDPWNARFAGFLRKRNGLPPTQMLYFVFQHIHIEAGPPVTYSRTDNVVQISGD